MGVGHTTQRRGGGAERLERRAASPEAQPPSLLDVHAQQGIVRRALRVRLRGGRIATAALQPLQVGAVVLV